MRMRSETAPVFRSAAVDYGVARSIDLTPTASSGQSLTFLGQANFFFCEYIKGLLFVVACSLVILAMPKVITKQGRVKQLLSDFAHRSMDILGAVVGLVLTAPFWILIPIIIKIDSPGSIFYSQIRVGLNRRKTNRRVCQQADVDNNRNRERRRVDHMGRLFRVYKFRTMVNDAESKSGAVWAKKNDARITRIGQFLRRSRIDEIPQFFNILVGDMSLVGPRPERPEFVGELAQEVKGYGGRLAVKPGLTGLAQVENGYDSSVASVVQKVKYDLEYIENRTIWNDIKIIIKTFVVVFTGKGAH